MCAATIITHYALRITHSREIVYNDKCKIYVKENSDVAKYQFDDLVKAAGNGEGIYDHMKKIVFLFPLLYHRWILGGKGRTV